MRYLDIRCKRVRNATIHTTVLDTKRVGGDHYDLLLFVSGKGHKDNAASQGNIGNIQACDKYGEILRRVWPFARIIYWQRNEL